MFAVNGPSGPTSRNERRAPDAREVAARKQAQQRIKAKRMGEFFEVRKLSTKAMGSAESEQQAQNTGDDKDGSNAQSSLLFKGCNVFFNGRTGKVSSYFLAKLVEEHGGTVGSAFTKTRITHIVATNLNGSKADKVLKSCGKIVCVRPEWILQSVKKQKREPEFEYLVYKQDNAVASAKSLLTPSNIGKQNLNDVDGSAMDQRSKRGY